MGSTDQDVTDNEDDAEATSDEPETETTQDDTRRNGEKNPDIVENDETGDDDSLTATLQGSLSERDGETEVENDEGTVGGKDEGRSGEAIAAGGSVTDEELAEIAAGLETTITVIGCGGAGSNTVTRMAHEGVHGATLVATNTDAQHLAQEVAADTKILLGRRHTGGRGAGADPDIGEAAAEENREDIIDAVKGSDMVFITAGMGGGTGTGAAPVIAEAAQDAGALTVAVVSMPFSAEGDERRANANTGLEQLRSVADTVIVVPNDRLLDLASDVPLQQAFEIADRVLSNAVKGTTELVTKPGLVNVDFADVRTVMENGGVAMIGLGESRKNDGDHSIWSALRSPLLDVDFRGATAALVNVVGGPEMSLEQAEGAVEELHDRISPDARVIWGASVDPEYNGKIETMVIITGVDSPQIYGQGERCRDHSAPEADAGLDVLQ